MLDFWNIKRATWLGILAGLAAILLGLGYDGWSDAFRPYYLAALGFCAFCGISILLITLKDMVVNPRRGARIAPVRGFDIAVGLILAVPSLLTLEGMIGL